MNVLINTNNEQEEKVLLAFLDSLQYNYQFDTDGNLDFLSKAFITQYNEELNQADKEIENGDFVDHEDVEELFRKRRKAI